MRVTLFLLVLLSFLPFSVGSAQTANSSLTQQCDVSLWRSTNTQSPASRWVCTYPVEISVLMFSWPFLAVFLCFGLGYSVGRSVA